MKDPREGRYLIRESYYEYMTHIQDDLKHTGYDWRSNLFKKSLSSYLLAEKNRSSILAQFQKMIIFLIDKVSMIKKSMNYTVSKHYKYLN